IVKRYSSSLCSLSSLRCFFRSGTGSTLRGGSAAFWSPTFIPLSQTSVEPFNLL
ncbi:hypothetical protein CHARACLAT_017674, partial [Characodon lateralis]|nr:hypothetical protein [Characodon lateralis]